MNAGSLSPNLVAYHENFMESWLGTILLYRGVYATREYCFDRKRAIVIKRGRTYMTDLDKSNGRMTIS